MSTSLILTYDTTVYRLSAIKKAIYKFSGRCLLNIVSQGDREAKVFVNCPDTSVNLQELLREIQREVTDQELREMVMEETVGVRNLLLAQAFSATSLITPDEGSVAYEDDPSGISVPDEGYLE